MPQVSESVKGRISRRRKTKDVMRPLEPEILAETTKDLANTVGRRDGLDVQKSSQMKIFNDSIKQCDEIISDLAAKIRNGRLAKIDVTEYILWDEGRVIIIDDATGEVVDNRDIQTEEGQYETQDEEVNAGSAEAVALSIAMKKSERLALPAPEEVEVSDETLQTG